MSRESRIVAAVILITFSTVVIGGVSVLSLLLFDGSYPQNALRQDLWRAGHAHAGVFLVLSLVVLRYVDQSLLPEAWKWFVRFSTPDAAILLPIAFFLSILSPDATAPNALVYVAYVGAAVVATGLFVLGIGLIRNPHGTEQAN